MKLNKTMLIVALIAMVLVALTTVVNAAANDDLYSYMEGVSVTVGGKTYKANESQLLALKQYLNSHELTNEQVSVVKTNVAEIVKTVESQNTADVSKFSSDAINKISANIDKIEAATNVKINYISADNTLQIKDANGTSLIEAKVGQSTNLVQTGTSYVPYIVVSGIALIAVAVLVAKKVTKKRVKKNVEHGQAHIQSSFNNTIVTLTDNEGNALSWASAGGLGFRGSRKSTPYAAQMAAETATKAALIHGLKTVDVMVKGPGSGREAAIRALQACGLEVTSIRDVTPVPHNGCRPPKRRRV